MNDAQRLMAARLGFVVDPNRKESSLDGINNMMTELQMRGGNPQQNRMILDKRRTLDRAVWYSYQGAFVQKMEGENPIEHPPVKGLINPNKLKQDYDDKILSIGFEHDFHVGDIFKWCNTNTYWIIYLQDLTELAYFRGDIRRCRYMIEWLDEEGKLQTTFAAVRGPVETKINYIQKHLISVDVPNHSLNILMPHTPEAVRYFRRYQKFYLITEGDKEVLDKGKEFCWRVEATDSISTPGILQINAVEYYTNQDEDADGVVGKLIQRPIKENDETDFIIGPMLIKPKVVYTYRVRPGAEGTWALDSKLPIKKEIKELEDGSSEIQITWDEYQAGRFDLSFGSESKTITVESLF